jgi:hypothetical protein
VSRAALDARTEAAMFALLAGHFDGVERATFRADLDAKSSVILLEDDAGVLRGFSTLLICEPVSLGGWARVVYSGDTIVAREWWGSPALARSWIHAVRRLVPGDGRPLHWLLLTSGFRTYRFLPVFFKSFHPRHDAVTPPGDQARLDAIAQELFGWRYDPGRGVVQLDRPQVLAGDLVDVPAGRAADPHVRFFLERNPGFVRGDELVCLTRIADDNLTRAGLRMAGRDRDGRP